MHGPNILARTLSVPAPMGPTRHLWQYHPRSDRHSKIACWGILFDLLQYSPVLAKQVREGKVAFGINHEMKDFQVNRKKNLDLVLCIPRRRSGGEAAPSVSGFRELVERYGIQLTPAERKTLLSLPDVPTAPVASVLMALEAKACMTEHLKARPRLYDELNSSHQTIHGDTDNAIAVGFVMVNMAKTFVSPTAKQPTVHRQPDVTERVIEKMKELPRRSSVREGGFDALAIVVVECGNDGKPVGLVRGPPAPPSDDIFNYEMMIQRLAGLYEARQR